MDERGSFHLTDRKKDMIVVSGFKVFPNEIEDVLTLHPDVLEAAAIGVKDERSGEAVKVGIVPTSPSAIGPPSSSRMATSVLGTGTPICPLHSWIVTGLAIATGEVSVRP